MNIFKKSVFFVILLITFISGCMHPRLELSEEKRHFVRYGETLYFIAWRYGINPQDLIAWNKISDKALIYPGQILKLSSPKNIRSTESLSPPTQKKTKIAKKRVIQSDAKWKPPTKGNVIKKFKKKSSTSSGILFDGILGQAITASSDGEVVYAGNGLSGFGQLVIVKHNDVFLSAYGYNEAIQVNSGDFVKQGQQIATMGLGPTKSPQLYFEIRQSGDPIDPMKVIPSI